MAESSRKSWDEVENKPKNFSDPHAVELRIKSATAARQEEVQVTIVDLTRDLYVLEFTGLPPRPEYT